MSTSGNAATGRSNYAMESATAEVYIRCGLMITEAPGENQPLFDASSKKQVSLYYPNAAVDPCHSVGLSFSSFAKLDRCVDQDLYATQ